MMAAHVGVATQIQALGRQWTVARYERRIAKKFLKWAKTQLPDPIKPILDCLDAQTIRDAETFRELMKRDQAEIETALKEGRQPVLVADRFKPGSDALVERAVQAAMTMHSATSPAMLAFMNEPDAQDYLLYLLLKENHAEATPEVAEQIMEEIGPQRFQELLLEASGRYVDSGKNGSALAA